jgi:predicted amidophosphoribosyltransferase
MEKDREKALQINYKLGNYGIKYCSNCSQPIENYKDIKDGLCGECKEELEE